MVTGLGRGAFASTVHPVDRALRGLYRSRADKDLDTAGSHGLTKPSLA